MMLFSRRLLVVLAWLAPVFAIAAQGAPDESPRIPAAALQADARIVREAYESLHPGLYRYNTREQMDGHFAALDAEFTRDRTLAEAYLAFSTFLAKLQCGHAYCNFYNQPKPVAEALLKNPNRIPLHFRWLDGRIIVTLNRSSDPSLVPGTEITSINGVPARDVLAKLMPLARADGGNTAKRVRYLEISGKDMFEAFDIFYPLLFDAGPSFELTAIPPGGGEPRETRVAALTYDQRVEPVKDLAKRYRSAEPVWEFTRREDGSAVLRMPGWALYNSSWDWKAWLAERFDEMDKAGTRTLIVDIRGNEGGLDCGNEIIARLIDRPIPFVALQTFVRYRSTPERLNAYLDTWDDSFRNWGDAAQPIAAPKILAGSPDVPYFKLQRAGRIAAIEPKGPRFAGRVFVLVDAVCSSATYQFTKVVKENKLATIIGEPTGGNQRGINGGAFFFLRLPNSKIEMDLPLIASFPPDDQPTPDAGIDPDVLVPTTAEDIAKGRDPQMEAVRRALSHK